MKPNRFDEYGQVLLSLKCMRSRRSNPNNIPGLFLIVITMVAIGLFVQVDRMRSRSKDVRAKAYMQTSRGVRVEAEEMTLSGVTLDSSGTFIQFGETVSPPTPAYDYYCPPQGAPAAGIASFDVDLNVAANYKMWVQMKGNSDSANSLWLQLDRLYCVKIGDVSGMTTDWVWVDFQNGNTSEKIPNPLIGTGHHIIKLIGNTQEPGVAVERFIMMIDNTCIPSGNGDECIGIQNTPTPTSTPPTPTPTPTPTPMPAASKRSPADEPIITTSSLPKASRDVYYAAGVSATDKTVGDSLVMSVQNVPPGLILTSCVYDSGLGGASVSCVVAGTPTTKGTYFPEFTVKDTTGNTITKRLRLQIV